MNINEKINKFAKKSMSLFELIFAVVFSIPLIVCLIMVGNGINRTNIAKNGTEANAVVTLSYCDMEVNGEPYYTTEFYFLLENGEKIEGKTDANPIKHQIGDTIAVKYNKNYKAVRADYKFHFGIEHIILFVFGCVGVGFFVAFFIGLKKRVLDRLAEKKGKEHTAIYMGRHSGITVNGQNYYSLRYVYKDENGKEHGCKTQSFLTYEDTEYYRIVNNFKVKVYKGHCCVYETPDYSRQHKIETEQKSEFKKCVYCGTQVKKSEIKCPNCGSVSFE
ncbi:MAG: hypothetical protein MJ066_00730 [Clostridia bacterium]|nr:hypothetical protein [Clostridia bacterium]